MKEQKELRVTRLSIKNILGIQSLEIRPDRSITVINGENASGKTSLIQAIQSIFKGGNDGSLLKVGADKGEIVLELNDGVKIERTVTANKSATMITHPEFGQISKPAAFLELLIDKLGTNPIDFLTAPAKMRVQLLLEAMPIKLDNDLIEPIIGHKVDPLDTNALELIDRESKRFYDDRTGVNRVAKEKRATILQMKQTLPEDAEDTDWARIVVATEGSLALVSQSVQMKIDAIITDMDVEKDTARGTQAVLCGEIDSRLEAEIARLRLDAEAKKDEIRADTATSLDRIHRSTQESVDKLRMDAAPEVQKLTGKLAVARENLTNQSKINQTKEYIKTLGEEATKAEAQSDKDTKTIEALANLKTKLLNDLPIKGVEVKDGELFVDSIPFDRVNEARKVEIAIQIAGLRSGKLPLIIVDGLERLDSKTFEAFKKHAAKSKVQMIVTRVSDSALAVEA